MRVLITGGAGFIGSHVADLMSTHGHEICALDNLYELGGGRREHIAASARFEQVDIRDAAALGAVFDSFQPEVVCHLAAQTSVARSARIPDIDADINVLGTLRVLNECLKAKTRKVVFASTAATYGTIDHLPANEETPQRPISPYGMTKLIDEQYLGFFARHHGLEYAILRYTNVYGPRQNPHGEGGVVAIFTGKFVSKDTVQINGDGDQTRDFIYVGDVAEANLLSLERGANQAYVIGTGVRTSVNDIYRALARITGFEAPAVHAPPRPGEARDNYCDPAKALVDLGWEARTTLEDGLRRTLDYNKKVLATL